MPSNSKYRGLSSKEKALVAMAVLLDGYDAVQYLVSDKERGAVLSRVAKDLASFALELRMPLSGTLLRSAVEELRNEDRDRPALDVSEEGTFVDDLR